MGKKNKKGGNDPKENKNPNDQEGPSGGGDKKKDSKDQPAKQQQQQTQKKGEQQQKPKGQPSQAAGYEQQGQKKKAQQQQTQGYQGAPQQQQSHGAGSQQGPKHQDQPQKAEQHQEPWQQQHPRGAGGKQQQPQGSQGPQRQPQGPQQQPRGPQQQPQGSRGQQQPQAARAQHPQGAQGQQQQQSQGAWSQPQPQATRGQPQPQGTSGQQQPQGAWSQQQHQGARSKQPQEACGPQQTQGAWTQQGSGQQQRSQQGQRTFDRQGQPGQGDRPQSQSSQGSWGGQGSRQQQQQQPRRGDQRQWHERQQSQSSQGSESSGQYRQQQQQRGQGQQRGQQQYQGGQYQQRQQYQQPQQQQAVVPLSPAHPNSPARGTLGKPFTLETNYLTLDLDKMPDVAYHYDVKIDPDRPKKFVRRAFDLYVQKVFPGCHLAYDGKANAYSAELLSEKTLDANQAVEVKVIEGTREVPYKVTMKPTDDVEIDLKSLKNYHNERIFDKPMRALQCIEVVLASSCHEKGIRAGRSFFTPPPSKLDLGDGFELWFGLYQAAILCDQPLLNVDVSHKSFPSEVRLDQYYDNLRRPNQKSLDDFLKGLRVLYTPPRNFNATPKEFKFLKVMDASSKETFKADDGTRQTVAQYFQSKGAPLKRPDLPCLHVGSSVKTNYIPLEFLTVPAGQAIMRKDSDNQVRQMIRYAATSTGERKEKIMRLLRHFEYNSHATVERFGLCVGNQFITVPARLLTSPRIEYANGRNITIDRPGEWMMKGVTFLKCDKQILHQWAIINISKKPEINELFLRENFVSLVVSTAEKLGMTLAKSCFQIKEPKSTGYRVSIKEDLNKLKANKVSIVFVILPFASESYAQVKQEAELSCGIVTQCIKGDTMRSESRNRGPQIINAMTVSNILLKVNAKLNGTNHKIAPPNEIKLQQTSKVMFVGADVSHPSPLQKNLPSIVGVVASHDLNGTQYNMQYRLQTPGVETIVEMKDIFTQHLNMYKASTNFMPDHIIYYRDGVSDGQFQLIDKIELAAMRTAAKAAKCNAKFTCIIVVKRHHTRFFPKESDGEGKFNNVKAGTVVDRTIIHPNEVQFFMVSHKAIQGTSKPTRYNVIVDDAKINIDDLQAMTYNLCHLFPRCNRSVSYPAPAYLAHLVGLRGRAYIEGSNLNLENLKAEYSKRQVSNDVMKKNPMYFV